MATCSCCGRDHEVTVTLHEHESTALCANCLAWLARRMAHEQAIIGGWRAAGHEPIFEVRDLAAAADHYTKLGFSITYHDDTYGFAHRERDLTIHLERATGAPRPSQLYVHCPDADQVALEWRRAGVTVDGPTNQEWGKREGSHVDPDGNLIRFGSPIVTDDD